MKVQHNRWFTLEVNGKEYRAKIMDHGFSYSTIRLEKLKMIRRPKYYIFGPIIEEPSWNIVTSNSREEFFHETYAIDRKRFYNAYEIRSQIEKIVKLKDDDYNHTHRI